MIHNFYESLDKEALPLWKQYLQSLFGKEYKLIDKSKDLLWQKAHLGDIVMQSKDRTIKIELKTRGEDKYLKYKYDILMETMSKWEHGILGSAFLNIQADLYAYGFLVDGELRHINILKVPETQQWFKYRHIRYRPQYAINEHGYKTEFKCVPIAHIPKRCFFYNPLPEQKI